MKKDYSFLKRIVSHLIIHASGLDNQGLYYGKTGVVLFFAHYARYTGNPVYEDFASELLNEVYEDLTDDTPVNFANGLCGIGWGILHLLENKFMEGEPDTILSDIDSKIMERDLSRISDLSVETGLTGISHYIKKRKDISLQTSGQKSFDSTYLQSWENAKRRLSGSDNWCLSTFVSDAVKPDGELQNSLLGISQGCAGYGLNILLI